MDIFMKLTYILLLLGLSYSASMAQVSKFTFDTVKTVTLEDKLKTKASEAIVIQHYLDNLLFREQLAKNSESTVFSKSASSEGGLTNKTELSSCDELLLLSRRLGDRKKESEALKAYGNLYALNGDLNKSIQFYKEALSLKEELNDKPAIIKTNYTLGVISRYEGHYDEAIGFYENAIKTASSLKSTAIIPQAYLEIALIRTTQVKNGEAEYLVLKKALPLFTRQGNRQGRINSFQALADIYHQQNRYSEAKWFYIQANTLARKANDKSNIISSLISLAKVKYALGHYELALKDYQEAELLASKNKNIGKLVEVKSGLGDLYYKMGNLIAAGKEMDEYAKLKSSILDHPAVAVALD